MTVSPQSHYCESWRCAEQTASLLGWRSLSRPLRSTDTLYVALVSQAAGTRLLLRLGSGGRQRRRRGGLFPAGRKHTHAEARGWRGETGKRD